MDVIRNCAHYYTCDDYSGGCVVCMDCGLVIQEQLFLDPVSSPYRNLNKRKSNDYDPLVTKNVKSSHRTKAKILSGKELILTVCKSNQLTDVICNEALKLLEAYISQRAKRGVQINESLYAGLALYNACVNNNAVRSKAEIASMMFISVKSLNRLESDFKRQESYIDNVLPSKLLPRVGLLSSLKVKFKTYKALGKLADLLYGTMCASPNSVLGFVLHQFLNSKKYYSTIKKTSTKKKNKYTLVYVANLCGITPSCIQRIIKLKGDLFDLPESKEFLTQL